MIYLVHAIVLGIIQGLTEFLPVSSSAHLIIFPDLLGWEDLGQTFDVALHGGTAIALLVYFWRDLTALLTGVGSDLVERCGRGRFIALLCLSAVPGGLVGVKWEHKIDEMTHPEPGPGGLTHPSPEFVHTLAVVFLVFGTCLIAFSLILALADSIGRKDKGDEAFGWSCLWMGCAQVLALIPGVSRSGSTMTMGLFLGLTREAAARFSFLISIPIICGAALYKLQKVVRHPEKLLEGFPSTATLGGSQMQMALAVYVAGVLASAVMGYLVVKYLIRYLNTGSFKPFVIYRIVLGLALIGYALTHWR